ncbi:hypothetical protein SOHN41_00458 [Shewanella sp. HN-41]|nr:hypothetical protein SOHN41_00458 [Shewanella sp. HN-41]
MNKKLALLPIYSPKNPFTYPLIIKLIKNGGETNIRISKQIQQTRLFLRKMHGNAN